MYQLSVNKLELGMKVVKLDKKWLDTPFLIHRFIIKSEKSLLQLRQTCKHVFVEHNPAAFSKKTTEPLTPILPQLNIEKRAEIHGVEVINTSFNLLNLVFSSLANSTYLNSFKVREIINTLITQVLKDEKTHLYLNLIQSKTPYMAQKSIRVTVLFLTFCKYIGIKKDKLFDLGCAALLHDIGMVKLPINFDKAGKLTYIERKHLFTHTEIGANLIEQSKTFPRAVSDIVRSHHENYDGSGYPKGLAKRDISLYSRMLTLICTYEAITRDRKYKAALNPYLSVSELARVSGFMLDPRLVARFIEVIGEYPFGTLVKTLDGEQLKVLDKAKGQKYFVTRPANDDKKNNFIMDSNLFTGVIYE